VAPSTRGSALGRLGEDSAAAWYLSHGYQILARNWRCRAGEIDLVCRRGRVLVFCEVKARSTGQFGSPFEAVTRAKRRRLRHLAALYLAEVTLGSVVVRFDVAGVREGHVEVLESAF